MNLSSDSIRRKFLPIINLKSLPPPSGKYIHAEYGNSHTHTQWKIICMANYYCSPHPQCQISFLTFLQGEGSLGGNRLGLNIYACVCISILGGEGGEGGGNFSMLFLSASSDLLITLCYVYTTYTHISRNRLIYNREGIKNISMLSCGVRINVNR